MLLPVFSFVAENNDYDENRQEKHERENNETNYPIGSDVGTVSNSSLCCD